MYTPGSNVWHIKIVFQLGGGSTIFQWLEFFCALVKLLAVLPSLSFSPLILSFISVTSDCFSPLLYGESWLGCKYLPAVGVVSIEELADNSGSSLKS